MLSEISDVKRYFFMQSESSESLSIYLPILNSGGGAKYTYQFFNNDESLIYIATLKLYQ